MKRICILAVLLAAAAACTTNTPAPINAPAPSTNANAAATPTAAATVSKDDIIAREKQVWEALKNKDFDGFANMLADDQIEVFGSGINDKAGSVKGVKDLALTDVTLSDWKVVMIDKDAAVVTYTVSLKGTAGGKEIPSTPFRASTAWVNRGGKWLAIYHQDTEATQAQAAGPPASGGAPAKATPTSAASPAATGGSASNDPIEKEKQVWDALKRKDYDGFASMLADDSLEVESDGVYDKAGSVNTVKQFDFSSASLSDFKVVKLDDDAALVTYLVKAAAKGFDPNGERHTTIWANRNGKWLAVFHQGTPVGKPAAK
jgi:hypothetical protein